MGRSIKEIQQTSFLKSSGKSKEVDALIGSLTGQEDKDDHTQIIPTIDEIKIGDRVRLKVGIHLRYGDGGIDRETCIGKVALVISKDSIYVNFPKYTNFQCTLDEIEFAR